MPISNISRAKTIALQLQTNSDKIQIIYENSGLTIGTDLISNHTIVSFNSFIKNLKVFASIASVDEALLPDFTIEDTATTKRMKVLYIEWKSPRKQLNLHIANRVILGKPDWLQIGSVSLLNTFGYPFKVYNVMDLFTDNLALELGENSKIGIQIQDVGYGLLTEQDKVTVHGSYTEEIFTVSPTLPNIININLSGIGVGTGTNSSSGVVDNNYLVDNTSTIGN